MQPEGLGHERLRAGRSRVLRAVGERVHRARHHRASARRSSPTTLRYPDEKLTLSPRWRGALRLTGILGRDDIPTIEAAPPEYNALIEELYAPRQPAAVRRATARPTSTRAVRRTTSPTTTSPRPTSSYATATSCRACSGRICHHPCETACKRNYYDEPIAIRPLHRVAYERYAEVREERVKPLAATREQTHRDHRQRSERADRRATT